MKCPLLLSNSGQNFIASPDVSKTSQHSDSLILIETDNAEINFRNFWVTRGYKNWVCEI